jgi:hypothetical protein
LHETTLALRAAGLRARIGRPGRSFGMSAGAFFPRAGYETAKIQITYDLSGGMPLNPIVE